MEMKQVFLVIHIDKGTFNQFTAILKAFYKLLLSLIIVMNWIKQTDIQYDDQN